MCKLFSILLGMTFFILCSCRQNKEFEVLDFNPITNYRLKDAVKEIEMDYSDAITNGFIVPTEKQVRGGYFHFQFLIINNGDAAEKFRYKIYYQNESYKFNEDHEHSDENFYGSWENVVNRFKLTPEIPNNGKACLVVDSFRIVGNPRNEKMFYGENILPISNVELELIRKQILNSPEWKNAILNKSIRNKVPFENQLSQDVIYVANLNRKSEYGNNRWKRNPRVGNYNFMLVVTKEKNIKEKKIPDYIQDIGLKKGAKFVNPFTFFSSKAINDINKTVILKSGNVLKLKASPQLGSGIYVNRGAFDDKNFSTQYYNSMCNESSVLYFNAHFEQFIHQVDKNAHFNNIPIVADVFGSEYSIEDYISNSNNTSSTIKTPIQVTTCPCKTVASDSVLKKIIIHNPGTNSTEWRKENVGVWTRHGFVYGKYTVKVKFPELLNKDKVWNGLTNAAWLLNQPGDWNQRRVCETGYISKKNEGEKAPREKTDTYSEIDFEIVKASAVWPKTSYPSKKKPKELISDSDKVVVTYTNWDLACNDKETKNYGVGVQILNHNDHTHNIHRWDHWYKAITGKFVENNDKIFKSKYFYFQIEWKPEEIIWRIGSNKENMYEIGYINSNVSSIPNNQMLFVVTQEFHLSSWWPEAPFDQNRIPFPKKDIRGEIYELEIE